MTIERGKEKAKIAKEHHETGEYNEAAEMYTAAAYEYLGVEGLEHALPVARGLRHLGVAAACFRYLGKRNRCQNRCWQGIYISEEVGDKAQALPVEEHAYDQSVRGVWFEFAGDFRTVGGLPDAEAAYEQAETIYAEAGDPETTAFEQYHMSAAVLPKLLFRGTDAETDDLDAVLHHGSTLTDWVDFKRRRLPDALKRLDEQTDWTYVF